MSIPGPIPVSAVVTLSGVQVAYGGAVVLEVPALEIQAGEILAVIGPNGAGKSTLLRVIGLLEGPTAGEVRFKGGTVGGSGVLAARRRMATVFQDPLLVDDTVFGNVALGLRVRRVGGGRIASPGPRGAGSLRDRGAGCPPGPDALGRRGPAHGARPRACPEARTAAPRRAVLGAGSADAGGADRRAGGHPPRGPGHHRAGHARSRGRGGAWG